jgi:hypothetical protein
MKRSHSAERLLELAELLRSRADALEVSARAIETEVRGLPAVVDSSRGLPAIPANIQPAIQDVETEAKLLDDDARDLESILKEDPSLVKSIQEILRNVDGNELFKRRN